MRYPITASPTAVDINSDGRVNYVYVVDTGNQLWRFNVGTAGTFDNTSNDGSRADGPPPGSSAHRRPPSRRGPSTRWTWRSTGGSRPGSSSERETGRSPRIPGTGRIYAIRDDGTGYPYNESNLFNLSSVIANTDNTVTGTVTTTPPREAGTPTFRTPTRRCSPTSWCSTTTCSSRPLPPIRRTFAPGAGTHDCMGSIPALHRQSPGAA